MGCDIHIMTEAYEDGEWKNIDLWEINRWFGDPDEPDDEPKFYVNEWGGHRDYLLFGTLAGVRYEQPYSLEPRGLPKDISLETQQEYNRTELDNHTPSWITYEELTELSVALSLKKVVGYDNINAPPLEHPIHDFRNAFIEHIKRYYGWAHRYDKLLSFEIPVRIVFWFDN